MGLLIVGSCDNIAVTSFCLQLDLAKDRETSGAKEVAEKLDIDRCFEASSKDGRGIDEVVDFLLEQVS